MKAITVTRFITDDGKTFDDELSARKHEITEAVTQQFAAFATAAEYSPRFVSMIVRWELFKAGLLGAQQELALADEVESSS